MALDAWISRIIRGAALVIATVATADAWADSTQVRPTRPRVAAPT